MAEQEAKPHSEQAPPTDATKGQTSGAGADHSAKPSEDVPLSEAQLDQEIEGNDPEFAKSLAGIEIDAADLALEILDFDANQVDENPKTFKDKIKLARRRLRMVFLGTYANLHARSRLFVTETLPHLLHLLKDQALKLLGLLKSGIDVIKHLEKKRKLILLAGIVMSLITGGYIYIASKKNLLESDSKLFLTSFESLADKVYFVKDGEEYESFYESIRIAQNIVTTPKLVVNIKRSSHSGENPMAAMDLYIEGLGPEVVVEIKDREVEFKDIMQRAIEDMTYDQLETVDGKKLLLEKIRRDVNQSLTQGKIKRVMYKTFIMKP